MKKKGHNWVCVDDFPSGYNLWECSKCGHQRCGMYKPHRDILVPYAPVDWHRSEHVFLSCEEKVATDVHNS